jgi:diguanylate cyclase (GGDEF)-like protein/PAS domain S-box-containing protein
VTDRTKVLIVDDERVNLLLLEGILRELDLEVVKATSGQEALDYCQEHDFAVVLLDIMMPGMDGFDVAERLRAQERTRNLPIIFVTALSAEQKYIFKGYEAGAVDYLVKPVEPEVLTSKVRVFVELHRRQHELEEAKTDLERAIARLRESEEALRASEERYRTIADYTFDFECWIDIRGDFLYASPSCERITGHPPEAFLNDPGFIEEIIHRDDLPAWREALRATSDYDSPGDIRIFRKDGLMRWLSLACRCVQGDDGRSLGVRLSLRDITQRKLMEKELRYQALHDPLTGLANRYLCEERIKLTLTRAQRRNDFHFAIIFMDIDRFKLVNDSYGHAVGDALLKELTFRLQTCVRNLDTVSRFGGDEFVILLEELHSPKEAISILNRMRDEVRRPVHIGEQEIHTTSSFGVMLGDPDTDAKMLLQNANIAMHRAKERGESSFKVFNPRMLEQAIQAMTMETDLRKAVAKREEFEVHYQPIVRLDDMVLVGFEALVRWIHPTKGFISPGQFIPVAEESGLILSLGRQVMEKACRTLADWRRLTDAAHELTISVNISPRQFRQATLIDEIEQILNETTLPPDRLKVEVTETAVMENPKQAAMRLNRLKELGVTVSIDDFGTGYSSMGYLQRLPLDHLKIDLSFVRDMDVSRENHEIVRTIINLAHNLDLQVVAEGVEKSIHQQMLNDLRCEFAQGYYFSKPVPYADALTIVEKGGFAHAIKS